MFQTEKGIFYLSVSIVFTREKKTFSENDLFFMMKMELDGKTCVYEVKQIIDIGTLSINAIIVKSVSYTHTHTNNRTLN